MGEKLSFLTKKERIAVMEFAEQVRKRLGPDIKEIILFGSKVRKNNAKIMGSPI